jgi:hypothetical protein
MTNVSLLAACVKLSTYKPARLDFIAKFIPLLKSF